MLFRKMLREMKSSFGQFFSVFILSALAVALFVTMKCNYLGATKAREAFHEATNLADGWLYGENFSEENLEAVRKLDNVNTAQLRMLVTGSAPEQDGAEVDLILENENIVNKPYILEGEEFDPADKDGVWLNGRFADAWNIHPGDSLKIAYNGVEFTKTVRGLIAAPEYEYMCASKDLEIDYKNIAYVYLSYAGFPAKDYVLHLIDTGDITVSYVLENTDLSDGIAALLQANGMSAEELTADMLKALAEQMSDEQLCKMLPYTQMLITTDEDEVLSLEDEIASAIDNNYAVFVDESSIPGLYRFSDELAQHNQFSYAFSLIFVLIAVLVIMTTMSRMVAKQRTQIGTMNAMGMKRRKITFHYIGYSFFVSLLGSIAGLFIGLFGIGRWFVGFFGQYYTVPDWKPGANYTYFVIIIVVVLACAGTSYLSCRKLLKVNPSESLRPAPPKSGKRCVFERLPFWDSMSFSARYNLRDVSRYKLRTFMGIFGTACGMLLMVCGIGCYDTLNSITEWNFEKLQNYDYEMVLEESMKTSEADALAEKYHGELVMAAGIEVAAVPHAVSSEKSSCTMLVTEGKGYFGITDANRDVCELEPGTVALTVKLAKKLGLSEGDTVYWHIYEKNEWYEAKIGVLNRNPNIPGVTMLREDFEKTGCMFSPASLYTDENVSGYQGENVTAVYNSDDIREAYLESMQAMYLMLFIMVGFSAVLVVIVLYNSGNLSFNERVKEFATLKVMGFRTKQIRSLLSIQNLWLSVIGILLGAPFGRMLMQYMLDSNGDSYDYPAAIEVPSYILSGFLVLAVSVSVSFLFSKRIKRLDMVEVLKGME